MNSHNDSIGFDPNAEKYLHQATRSTVSAISPRINWTRSVQDAKRSTEQKIERQWQRLRFIGKPQVSSRVSNERCIVSCSITRVIGSDLMNMILVMISLEQECRAFLEIYAVCMSMYVPYTSQQTESCLSKNYSWSFTIMYHTFSSNLIIPQMKQDKQ